MSKSRQQDILSSEVYLAYVQIEYSLYACILLDTSHTFRHLHFRHLRILLDT